MIDYIQSPRPEDLDIYYDLKQQRQRCHRFNQYDGGCRGRGLVLWFCLNF